MPYYTIRRLNPKKGLYVIFDPVGGKSVREGFQLLSAGGRIVSFGVSSMNQARSVWGKLQVLAQFGFYHPIQLLSQAKGMIGVNMLKIGGHQPEKVSRAMEKVIALSQESILKPFVGGEYNFNQLAETHEFLESRKSMGKIVVKW
jgi:NADPH2:quinone reductase